MYNTAWKSYNDLLTTYFDRYYDLLDIKRSKRDPKYDPANLNLDEYGCSEWYEEKSSDD